MARYGVGGESVDDPRKSYPKPIPVKSFGQAKAVPVTKIAHRASHVIVNTSGSFNFLYETTCSEGSLSGGVEGGGETYVPAITVHGDAEPIRLDNNPVAWSGSRRDGDLGQRIGTVPPLRGSDGPRRPRDLRHLLYGRLSRPRHYVQHNLR